MPKPVRTKGIVREGEDFRFVFVEPSQALVKRYLVLLPVAVADVDRQPISSTLSKRLAVCKFEKVSSAIVRLRVYQLRYRRTTPPMVIPQTDDSGRSLLEFADGKPL